MLVRVDQALILRLQQGLKRAPLLGKPRFRKQDVDVIGGNRPAGKQKNFRHEQHKPPNARFGSFAIHAEDFASVIIFRLIRQTRANGRIACLRVYCTIRAGFVNAFLHAPALDIFSPSGV
ncbi:hypothetical protein [Hominenteromicrobium sp.]|uniref:hypothetical protein n=1 Tax=Hominenteromicrobium sp. TaxID=3073581 RepID=UPI003AB12DC0